MKQVTIKSRPSLDKRKEQIVDLHSIFNVLNVVAISLEIGSMAAPEALRHPVDQKRNEIDDLVKALRAGDSFENLPLLLHQLSDEVRQVVSVLMESMEAGENRNDVKETLENLNSIFEILGTRLKELDVRSEDPDKWIRIESEEFRTLFKDVFLAIEKNARGRYRIAFNLARKHSEDYYIDLNVETTRNEGDLWIPLRLIDVLRDLTANARKYTAPGGKVALAVYEDDKEIVAVIEDSGCGIPPDELDRVVEFGYRATNVSDHPTMGGGFGLTKAAFLILGWGGRMTLASEVGQGTRIEIQIPCAAE